MAYTLHIETRKKTMHTKQSIDCLLLPPTSSPSSLLSHPLDSWVWSTYSIAVIVQRNAHLNFLLFCRALRFQSHQEKEKERVPEYWKLALFFRFIPILFDGTASVRARSHSFTNTPWTHLEIFFINRFLSLPGSLFFTHPIWLCRAHSKTITTGPITWISLDSHPSISIYASFSDFNFFFHKFIAGIIPSCVYFTNNDISLSHWSNIATKCVSHSRNSCHTSTCYYSYRQSSYCSVLATSALIPLNNAPSCFLLDAIQR